MPQGSRIGLNEFPPYTSAVFDIAKKHNIDIHMYADDTQLYLLFYVEDFASAKSQLGECIAEIRIWLSQNVLKLNDQKTECLLAGQKQLLNKVEGEKFITIGNSSIQLSSYWCNGRCTFGHEGPC